MPQFSIEKRVHMSLVQIFGVIIQFNTPLHRTGSMRVEAFVFMDTPAQCPGRPHLEGLRAWLNAMRSAGHS